MEAKVPQRIDMEDRVIGPLTLTQFFYLLFGGLFIWLLNSWTSGSALRILFYPIALIIAVTSFALAFVKIQDRPFITFVLNIVQYISKPRRRTWQKVEHKKLTQIVPDPTATNTGPVRKNFNPTRVADVVRVLDKDKNDTKQ